MAYEDGMDVQTLFEKISGDPGQWALDVAKGNTEAYRIASINKALTKLKQGVKEGKITVAQLAEVGQPLITKAQESVGRAGNSVLPQWQELQGFLGDNDRSGKAVFKLPFSRTEYAKLPNEALPTQDDIKKGFFDPSLAPMERVREAPKAATPTTPPTTPQVNPGPTPTQPTTQPAPTGQPAPSNQPAGSPAPATNGGQAAPIPEVLKETKPGLDLTSDPGKLEAEGARQAAQLAAVLEQQNQIRQQGLGTLNNSITEQAAKRKADLEAMSKLLADRQMEQYNRAIPDLAEQANTKGILQSTGFGDILANKYRDLTADTQYELAKQGLSDSSTTLQQQYDLAKQGYGVTDQYAGGLADVANTKLGFQTSGLQRGFSLSDYAQQVQDMAKYGQAPNPTSQSGSKGAGAVSGGLSGAATGGAVGGPWGAAIGGTIGAVGGGQASRK